MAGLLGEQAPVARMATPAFAQKVLGRTNGRFAIQRGVGYGGNKSLDAVAYSDEAEAVFGEVKNWSLRTWDDYAKRKEMYAQLERHNRGIVKLMRDSPVSRTLEAKVLFIRKEPFLDQVSQSVRDEVEDQITKLGWKLEYIPKSDIPTFGEVIDALR